MQDKDKDRAPGARPPQDPDTGRGAAMLVVWVVLCSAFTLCVLLGLTL